MSLFHQEVLWKGSMETKKAVSVALFRMEMPYKEINYINYLPSLVFNTHATLSDFKIIIYIDPTIKEEEMYQYFLHYTEVIRVKIIPLWDEEKKFHLGNSGVLMKFLIFEQDQLETRIFLGLNATMTIRSDAIFDDFLTNTEDQISTINFLPDPFALKDYRINPNFFCIRNIATRWLMSILDFHIYTTIKFDRSYFSYGCDSVFLQKFLVPKLKGSKIHVYYFNRSFWQFKYILEDFEADPHFVKLARDFEMQAYEIIRDPDRCLATAPEKQQQMLKQLFAEIRKLAGYTLTLEYTNFKHDGQRYIVKKIKKI